MCGVNNPPLSSDEVKERVELYVYCRHGSLQDALDAVQVGRSASDGVKTSDVRQTAVSCDPPSARETEDRTHGTTWSKNSDPSCSGQWDGWRLCNILWACQFLQLYCKFLQLYCQFLQLYCQFLQLYCKLPKFGAVNQFTKSIPPTAEAEKTAVYKYIAL